MDSAGVVSEGLLTGFVSSLVVTIEVTQVELKLGINGAMAYLIYTFGGANGPSTLYSNPILLSNHIDCT